MWNQSERHTEERKGDKREISTFEIKSQCVSDLVSPLLLLFFDLVMERRFL